MPVYQVQIDEFRQRMLYFFLNTASNEVFILGQSLDTDSVIVENCVIPETLFRMQHTWLRLQLSYNLTNGSSVDVSLRRSFYDVSSERNSSARLPNADCG